MNATHSARSARPRRVLVGLTTASLIAAVSACSAGSGHTATGPPDHAGSTTSAAIHSGPISVAPGAPRSTSTPRPTTPPVTVRPLAVAVIGASKGTALALLAHLAVKGRAPMTGYTREQFGTAWADVNHNGCDTRDDVLSAQLQHVVKLDSCRVSSGTEVDPYTGVSLSYVRGRSTVDIDHVAALGDDWQTGAQKLTRTRRTALANDPLNLLAVSASANRQKGDADAASWLPKVKSYRCAYVARQVAVKYRYSLWVTRAEHDAIARVLSACPNEPAPTGEAPRGRLPATPAPKPVAHPTPHPSPPPSSPPPAHVVHPGSFCAPKGATGVTAAGTAMTCGPASDGRNRWHHA